MGKPRSIHPDDVWRITLVPTGDGPPMPIRMRRFLKAALRAYGLRCAAMDGGDGQEVELLAFEDERRLLGTEVITRRTG